MNNLAMKAAPLLTILALLLPCSVAEEVVNLNNGNNVQSISSQINQALIKRLQELTDDPSKLQPIQKQHYLIEAADNDDDFELSPERLARETLLTTRLLNISLNRARIDNSRIDGAGHGLFAMEDIAKGEIITCYPGDALLCEYSYEGDDEVCDDEECYDEDSSEEFIHEVIWGEHVPMKERMEEGAVFDGIKELSIPPLTSYSVSLDDVCSILGLPALDKDSAYYGHFANDGAAHLFLSGNGVSVHAEAIISAYGLESVALSNAEHKPLDTTGGSFALGGLHIVTVATKNIKEGEEILVTYGHDYWMIHES